MVDAGVQQLGPVSDVMIIVDILSFSTCVDIAVAKGAFVYPYRWKDQSAIGFAESVNAELASFERKFSEGYSLSPASLLDIASGTKLVLPSPNGSTLSLACGVTPVLCGSLRNAAAVAKFASGFGKNISIIASGEHWEDHTLRFAFEDLVGAGAIISCLTGELSPESKTALAAFENVRADLTGEMRKSISGKELLERGFEKDITLACDINVSLTAPVLIGNRFEAHY